MEREIKKRTKSDFDLVEKYVIEKLRKEGMPRMATIVENELLLGYTVYEILAGLSDTQEIIKDGIWLNSPPVGDELL